MRNLDCSLRWYTLLTSFPSPRIIGMTATLNNHSEISSFLRCSYLVGGARPVELEEAVKIGDQVMLEEAVKLGDQVMLLGVHYMLVGEGVA